MNTEMGYSFKFARHTPRGSYFPWTMTDGAIYCNVDGLTKCVTWILFCRQGDENGGHLANACPVLELLQNMVNVQVEFLGKPFALWRDYMENVEETLHPIVMKVCVNALICLSLALTADRTMVTVNFFHRRVQTRRDCVWTFSPGEKIYIAFGAFMSECNLYFPCFRPLPRPFRDSRITTKVF